MTLERWVKRLMEEDPVDPLTLMNQIYAHDMRSEGYNWVSFQGGQKKKLTKTIFKDSIAQANRVGGVVTEEKKKDTEAPAATAMPPETNNTDPRIFSTDPELNACPAFVEGICRIDARPCGFSNMDYRECGKYYLATSGEPDLFEIPFGREQAAEFIYGIHD